MKRLKNLFTFRWLNSIILFLGIGANGSNVSFLLFFIYPPHQFNSIPIEKTQNARAIQIRALHTIEQRRVGKKWRPNNDSDSDISIVFNLCVRIFGIFFVQYPNWNCIFCKSLAFGGDICLNFRPKCRWMNRRQSIGDIGVDCVQNAQQTIPLPLPIASNFCIRLLKNIC